LIQKTDSAEHDFYNSSSKLITGGFRSGWFGAGDRVCGSGSRDKRIVENRTSIHHADLQAIIAPTLVITGENDIIDLARSSELAERRSI
jgi:pimeloyl-ACP methyl ester carboxylesterase